MPFSEQAQQYHDYYNQWDQLGQDQFDPTLADLVTVARQGAVDHMAELEQTAAIRQEMQDIALGANNERDGRLQGLEQLAQAADGLLTDEQIEARRAEILADYPEPTQQEQDFAHGFVLARVMRETVLPGLVTLGMTELDETTTSNPEYAGSNPVLSYREAFFLVGTLAGRGERIQELRQDGLDLPTTEELEGVWYQLRESMSLDERQEIDALFSHPSTPQNDQIVRAERKKAADRVIEIIEAGEFGDQYEYLLYRYDEIDPRCYVMDFIDSVPEEQLELLHRLLQRIADPTVPIVNMAGRVIREEIINTSSEGTHALALGSDDATERPADAYELVEPVGDKPDHTETPPDEHPPAEEIQTPEWVTEAVEQAFLRTLDVYQSFGKDVCESIPTHVLKTMTMIPSGLRTDASGINGLLSESARKSSKKATHDFVDAVILTAYSMRRDLFGNLGQLSTEEQQELRSTRPREVRHLAESLLRQHLEEQAAADITG